MCTCVFGIINSKINACSQEFFKEHEVRPIAILPDCIASASNAVDHPITVMPSYHSHAIVYILCHSGFLSVAVGCKTVLVTTLKV